MKNIIILSQPRTGSNLLCEMFFSYLPFRVLMEFFIYFHDENDMPHSKLLRTNELDTLFEHFKPQQRNILSLTTELNQHPKEAMDVLSSMISHYKIIKLHDFMFKQMDLEFIFNDPETKFIVLERSSKIKQYISGINANKLRKWQHVDTSDMKVQIDPSEFLKFKQASNSWYQDIEAKLQKNGCDYLKLNYEEDLEELDQTLLLAKINNWLDRNGIRYINTGYKVKFFNKQNNSPVEDLIVNYDEIKDLLA